MGKVQTGTQITEVRTVDNLNNLEEVEWRAHGDRRESDRKGWNVYSQFFTAGMRE